MKWICPTCGQKHSIPDGDRGKWEGKTRCTFCPPIRRKIKLPKVDIKPPQDLESTLEGSSDEQLAEDYFDDKFNDKDNVDLDRDISGFKAFVPESDKVGDVTADTEKKQFREKGYEGKKSGQRKRGRKKK